MQKQDLIIRDTRTKDHYIVDDKYLNGYARVCGIYATGVYNVLCRHADFHTQTSFPSIETIAEKLNISKSTVSRSLVTLEEYGIILRERVRNAKTARWKHNSYTLVDKSLWKPHVPQTHGEPHVSHDDVHMSVTTKTHMSHRHTKDSHSIKDSHKEGYTYTTDFLEFWNKYPRKVGKGAAWTSWTKMRPKISLVLPAIEVQLQSSQWKRDNGQYIPHPATWLNQRRWEDEETKLPELAASFKKY